MGVAARAVLFAAALPSAALAPPSAAAHHPAAALLSALAVALLDALAHAPLPAVARLLLVHVVAHQYARQCGDARQCGALLVPAADRGHRQGRLGRHAPRRGLRRGLNARHRPLALAQTLLGGVAPLK